MLPRRTARTRRAEAGRTIGPARRGSLHDAAVGLTVGLTLRHQHTSVMSLSSVRLPGVPAGDLAVPGAPCCRGRGRGDSCSAACCWRWLDRAVGRAMRAGRDRRRAHRLGRTSR
ncbi:MAG: hypothetical protein MZW92_77505 [Comamonadaceae bacterium]|nr:hypothetical protein [Comamonadaceae bacterium]